jgi:GTPase SAR1 family protein
MSSSATDATQGFDCRLKTICIGDPGVGKSCLVSRLGDLSMKGPWSDRYVSTLSIDYTAATYQVRNLMVKFYFWDLGGRERFRAANTSRYRAAEIIFLIIDTTESSPMSDVLGASEALCVCFICLLNGLS